jgi:hypothetical protein
MGIIALYCPAFGQCPRSIGPGLFFFLLRWRGDIPPSSVFEFKFHILYGLPYSHSPVASMGEGFCVGFYPYCVGCTRTALVQRWRQENLSSDKIETWGARGGPKPILCGFYPEIGFRPLPIHKSETNLLNRFFSKYLVWNW